MQNSSNNLVGYTELFWWKFSFNSYTELRSHQIKLKWTYMINSYHQKTFMIVKLNVMSKSNIKTLQYKQNIWKGSYKYSIEQGIFNKKW